MATPDLTAVDMRRTKLKAEEAALIAGELVKPSWASKNEGIHERVSFEDTLWGFEMAGGAYYKTPLRIVYVKPGSRAEQACIRMGDQVLRIQGIDTSTLTLQEAHQLVQDAGINLKIAVTSPDDIHDAHYEYEDPLLENAPLTPEQLKALERERIQKAIANAIRCRDVQWPWCRRKFIIYRESNCFMVPSNYEDKHRDLFPEQPSQKFDYFFPMEALEKVKVKSKGSEILTEQSHENGAIDEAEENGEEDLEEEEEKYVSEEEYEEEIPDGENVEEIQREDSNERLQEKSIPIESSQDQNVPIDSQEKENELENKNQPTDDSIRMDFDQEPSNYELDNNNNHVVNSKNNVDVEEPSENVEQILELEDKIINEVAANDNEPLPNDDMVKNDDEIIDSVLNDNDTW